MNKKEIQDMLQTSQTLEARLAQEATLRKIGKLAVMIFSVSLALLVIDTVRLSLELYVMSKI